MLPDEGSLGLENTRPGGPGRPQIDDRQSSAGESSRRSARLIVHEVELEVPADDTQNLLRRTPDAIASRFEGTKVDRLRERPVYLGMQATNPLELKLS
jgi:hypothetical protein